MILPKVAFVEARGNVVRDCPGTRNHICCGYKTIDLVEGCILSCSYCILKAYINSPDIKITRDVDSILSQINEAIETEKIHILRFGTGELSDSLALDRRYRLNRPLVEFFGQKKKALLELKSKWAYFDHLRESLNPYTIISFSVAPQPIIGQEEIRTSPLYKRLKAARRAQDAGCFVGLHLDPIIIYPGFEKDYHYLIDDISRILDLKRVIWVSLGLLRFPPRLMDRFIEEGRKNLLHGEFIRGEDGKYRYLKSERIRVYEMLYKLFKSRETDLFIYLCMEREDVWKSVTGITLTGNDDLVDLFDRRINQLYGGTL
ncbi:MAG: Spore photoproduct lyase [Syntrophorhabdus sp. PtaU1.Bin002]|nr:MAG: Spore photoproduct lyase [Syntrophorhabdus sp. PtaU1.Bin002]